MPNYNISVVVDPAQAEAGVNVVEGGLNRVRTAASSVKAAIQRAFDFNSGPAAAATSAVDKALDGVTSSARAAADQVFRVNDSLKLMSAPSVAAAANLRQVNDNLVRLYGTTEQNIRQNGRVVNSQGQVRQSTLQMSANFNDFATTVLSGGSAITAFAQQSGQMAFALQGMNGKLGAVGSFLAGPWGTILIVATTLLAGFLAHVIKLNNELDEGVKKLKEDAHETELNQRAKEAFNKTLEGQIALQRELNKELDKSIKTQQQLQAQTLLTVQNNLAGLRGNRPGLAGELSAQQSYVDDLKRQLDNPITARSSQETLGIAAAYQAAVQHLQELKQKLADTDNAIAAAERAVREAQQPLIQNDVEASLDKKAAATRRYTVELGRLNAQLSIGAGKTKTVQELQPNGTFIDKQLTGISTQQYRTELARITKQRDDAIKAAQLAEREANRGDGVARFRTREQAIGIAGRELQQGGLRVSENEQFGGVTASHPGMGNTAHGKYAIDVNSGAGVTEANIPDLKKRFDDLALRYQDRGYRVLWNGQVYEPGGHGPSHPITSGDKHLDHMHVEAPQSIIGKATQSSTESQATREYREQQTKIEQQGDFVSGVVDTANARGQDNRVQTVQAQIEKVYADYKRKFNEEMSKPDKQKVASALTAAEARETALHFQQAYVDPLDRLRKLEGLTGETREIANRKLEEQTRLGRELTPVEAQQIENSVTLNNELQRQAAILEELQKPREEYANRIADLNKLLAEGKITQTDYNASVADLGSSARGLLKDLPGADPNTGKSYSEIAATADEEARYAHEQQMYEQNRQQLLDLGINYDALEEAAKQRHMDNLQNIERQTYQTRLAAAQEAADALLGVAEAYAGKQSGIYKGIFLVSKAFAIAQAVLAIQQNIAEASKYGFPQNIPFIAAAIAQGASILQNIQAISAQFRTGGYTGDADPGRVVGYVHGREFVMNERATRENRAELEAMNSGRTTRQASVQRQARNDNAPGGQRPVNVHIDASAAPGIEWDVGSVTHDEVEIIAKRVVAAEAPKAVAGDLRNPNGRVSRALGSSTTAKRKRG